MNDEDLKCRIAKESCPGYGSCGGMFTYNTMQTFIAMGGYATITYGIPASNDPIRLNKFPEELVNYLGKHD